MTSCGSKYRCQCGNPAKIGSKCWHCYLQERFYDNFPNGVDDEIDSAEWLKRLNRKADNEMV